MRKRLYEIIDVAKEGDSASHFYDVFMMTIIIISLIPLGMKQPDIAYVAIERITVGIFIVDYFLRWATADLKLQKGMKSFLYYPFTFMAVMDLISILPTLFFSQVGIKTLRVLKFFRLCKLMRVFKLFRHSKSLFLIAKVLQRQKDALIIVSGITVSYIFLSALVIFNVEPQTFPTFFDAVYWSAVTLMTVGYGDICVVSKVGKFMTMISMIFGVAIVALPTGIITAGYMDEVSEKKK